MAEIKLYDYTAIVDDGWWGTYEMFYCIGQGELSASNVVPKIEAVPDGEDVTVKINSVGGYVFDGWSIYNALIAKKKTGNKIIVRVEGLAASIASIIAMAGDEVIICQAAMLMIHKPTVGGLWYDSLDAEDLKREANSLDQIQAVLNSIYTSKTGLEVDQIDSMINAETWITPSQAVLLGFATSIDIVTAIPVPVSMPENTFNHVFKNADTQTRAYANKTIKINKTIKSMDAKEVLQKNTEAMNESNSLMKELKNKFKSLFGAKNEGEENLEQVNASSDLTDGSKIHYLGVLGVGTEVFTDEAMTEHVAAGSHDLADGNYIVVDDAGLVTEMEKKEDTPEDVSNSADVEALQAENSSLQEALNASNAKLNEVNSVLQKLKDVKSSYTPESRNQEIIDKNKNSATDGKLDLSKEAREARRAEREEIKNSKKTK